MKCVRIKSQVEENLSTITFNTTFTISPHRPNSTTSGVSVTFVIMLSLDAPLPESKGLHLGLNIYTSLDGDPSNHLVTIELDTMKESFDPDDNHIGLNVNSVISNVTANLTTFDIEITPVNVTNYTLWIDYDEASHVIRVHMSKPTVPVLSQPLDLSEFVLQHSYFGFIASIRTTYELNHVLAWNLTVEKLPDDSDNDGAPAWKLGVF
ncbi:hypothetical protein C4D60_Mb06t22210 [Musa balbisiana]|uniref:Legume lectin domain-containing protein n=1 Tax=Musa balbisiana TaxID=52838 RepID=A0A4S8IQ07_MUSBA|nr:hypothetical protein C4D60_Mb06t22210 [Musa balbisiana]